MTRAHLQNWPTGFQTRLISVVQGQFEVSSDPNIAFTTVLGSCISVCMFDSRSKVGGMNHYLLADAGSSARDSLKYGAYAMELLINGLLKKGASRAGLQAKIFGGSMMSGRFGHIGQKNAEFARNFLESEGFQIVLQDTGGTAARRINFHPTTGQARLMNTSERVTEVPTPTKPPVRKVASNSAILF